MMQKPPRPTGVTILAILAFIGGIILLLGGLAIAAIGSSGILAAYGYSAFSGFATGAGVAVLIVGLLAILDGWGLWTGKGWAWILTVVLSILGILSGLVSLATGSISSVVGIIIDALILWYFWKPHVKAYFGKGAPMVQPAPSMQAPTSTTT